MKGGSCIYSLLVKMDIGCFGNTEFETVFIHPVLDFVYA